MCIWWYAVRHCIAVLHGQDQGSCSDSANGAQIQVPSPQGEGLQQGVAGMQQQQQQGKDVTGPGNTQLSEDMSHRLEQFQQRTGMTSSQFLQSLNSPPPYFLPGWEEAC